jgi:hypothetical protein
MTNSCPEFNDTDSFYYHNSYLGKYNSYALGPLDENDTDGSICSFFGGSSFKNEKKNDGIILEFEKILIDINKYWIFRKHDRFLCYECDIHKYRNNKELLDWRQK